MKILRFKTSLKCEGCVQAVKPFLDKVKGIESWSVDLTSPNKIIEVKSISASEEEIIKAILEAIGDAGYTVEKID